MKRLDVRAIVAAAILALTAATAAFAVGTPAGTNISNQATVNYTDTNGNPLTALSNIVTTVVSQVASLTVDPDHAGSAAPGSVIYYAHVVTNGGNGPDTINLTVLSSSGWTTALFLDANGNGVFDAGDTLLTDTNADGTVDTGSMAANAVVKILVRISVPVGAVFGTVDSTAVTGHSVFNSGVSDSATDVTTLLAPSLSVTKSVAPAGPQPPGTVLTYTMVVTNNGNANAITIEMRDPVPGFTTYVAGSITLNGGAQTDVGGDDASDFNVTHAGEVTVAIGSLAPGGSSTVTFQVRIN